MRLSRAFRRYNITSEDDLRDAMTKTNEYVSALPKEPKVVQLADAKGQK